MSLLYDRYYPKDQSCKIYFKTLRCTSSDLKLSNQKHKINFGDNEIIILSHKDEKNYTKKLLKIIKSGVIDNDIKKSKETTLKIMGIDSYNEGKRLRYYFYDKASTFYENYIDHLKDINAFKGKGEGMGVERLFDVLTKYEENYEKKRIILSSLLKTSLTGKMYPKILLSSAIEHAKKSNEIKPEIAAIIMGYFNRKQKMTKINSLKIENNMAYLIGKYYGSFDKEIIKSICIKNACERPYLYYYYIKNKTKKVGNLKLKRIIKKIESLSLPDVYSIEEQGLFLLGYYKKISKTIF